MAADASQELDALRSAAIDAFEQAGSAKALEAVRIEVLGKKGKLKRLQKTLFAKAAPSEKRALGAAFNPVQAALEEAYGARKEVLGGPDGAGSSNGGDPGQLFDVTLPGAPPLRGTLHPITQTIREVIGIFRSMGFAVEDGPEVEDTFHSFDALNIPEGHLARDPNDNFVLTPGPTSSPAPGKRTPRYFRSQTSTAQIRVMETQAPPIRCIVPGRVYRPDTVDATHHFMFHQMEGLVVGEGITFRDLKFVLQQFLEAYYAGQDFEWRLRPHFFPFTEASAEVDVKIASSSGSSGEGRWLEMLGCGMVDPAVFESVDIDPERYTGFAFGMGVERLAMLKHQIPVHPAHKGEDVRGIRHFYDNDIRFLRQF